MRNLLVIIILQLVVMQQALADETIGRLFFTPEQRQHLERFRNNSQHDSVFTEAEASEAKPSVSTLPELTIQGYVERSDGRQSTRWVNGKPLQDGEIE